MGNYHAPKRKSDTYLKRNSFPLRIYLQRGNIEALSGLSERLGVSISSLVNATVKVGLKENHKAVIQDAKGAKTNG